MITLTVKSDNIILKIISFVHFQIVCNFFLLLLHKKVLLCIKDQTSVTSHTQRCFYPALSHSFMQIHLIVTVPKYYDQNITEEVTVQMLVSSGGKVSEPHSLTYYPLVTKKGKLPGGGWLCPLLF